MSHPQPSGTHDSGLHPVGALRLPMRLRDPNGRVSTPARIASYFGKVICVPASTGVGIELGLRGMKSLRCTGCDARPHSGQAFV